MIRVLTGDNDFLIWQTIATAKAEFTGSIESVDGVDLELNSLADLLAGGGLFSQKKLVIISGLSQNKLIWPQLPTWLNRVDQDTDLILVEPKLDKRTATTKALQTVAEIEEFKVWTDRDQSAASRWTIELARSRGLVINQAVAAELVRRSMVAAGRPGQAVVDQWRISHGIDKLRAIDDVSVETVQQVIELEPRENSFELLNAALSGRVKLVQERLAVFRQSEEPHMLYGLIVGQVFQLLALALADKPAGQVAKDLGVHPYALEKLVPYARQLGRRGALRVVEVVQAGDRRLKSSAVEPWLLLESVLLDVAQVE